MKKLSLFLALLLISVFADAQSAYCLPPTITSVTGVDFVNICQSSATKKISLTNLKTFINTGVATSNIYTADGTLTGNRNLFGGGFQLNMSGLLTFSATSTNALYCTTSGLLQVLSVTGNIEIGGSAVPGTVSLLQANDKLFIPSLAVNNSQTKMLVWNSADGKIQYRDISSLDPGYALTSGTLSQFASTSSLQLKTIISDETGSGALVFASSPNLITPVLGVATAISLNGNTFTTGTYTLTGVAGKTLTFNKTLTLEGTDGTTITFPTTSATLARTDAANTFTGHQTIEGVTSTGATGTGKFVFDASPTLVTPVIGVASATSINKVAITAPATSATITVDDGFTLHATGDVTALSGSHTGTSSGTNTGDNVIGYTVNITTANETTTTDAQTVYFGGAASLAPGTTADQAPIYIPKSGTIKIIYLYSFSTTAGTNEAWTINIRKNNTTSTAIGTLSLSTQSRLWSNTALSIAVSQGDRVEIEAVHPTWATNPANVRWGGSIYIE